MAFPPNYNQERKSRDNAKNRKALEKQQKRDEKSAQRKYENITPPPSETLAPTEKKDD
jgi:phage-related minor tail protein